MALESNYSVFKGSSLFCRGDLQQVVLKIKSHVGDQSNTVLMIFSDSTGNIVDFNFHGNMQDVEKRLSLFISPPQRPASTGPGRPKLGVVSREVSLLPKHWEWLATQSGGSSASLRRLVEVASKQTSKTNIMKSAQERTYRFMSAIGGDLPGYEEALRVLYRKQETEFRKFIDEWPVDIKDYVIEISQGAFESGSN